MRLTNYLHVPIMFIFFFIGSSTKVVTYKGVLDRIEDNDQAVILLETNETTLVVPQKVLPIGSKTNMWFNIELINTTYKIISIDYQLTEKREQNSTHLTNKLRKKGEFK